MTREKRDHGTGSIVQIGPTRFRVRFTDNTGKRHSGGVYPSRDKAERVLAELVSGLAESGRAPVGVITWAAYANEWLKTWARCREDTRVLRRTIAAADWADMPIDQIHRKHVHTWFDELSRKVRRRSTFCAYRSLVGSVFSRAVADGLLESSPSSGYKIRRVQEPEAWTYLEAHEIVHVLHHDKLPTELKLSFQFMVGTGLRRMEWVLLRTSDVDWVRREIVVRRGNLSGTTKSKKIRRVPLLPIAEEALQKWIELNSDRIKNNAQGLLWAGSKGGVRRDFAVRLTRRVSQYTGLRVIRLHDLRHTFAAALLSGYWGRRWSLEEIQVVLGHSSIHETQRYAHLASGALQRAAAEARDQFDIGHALKNNGEK